MCESYLEMGGGYGIFGEVSTAQNIIRNLDKPDYVDIHQREPIQTQIKLIAHNPKDPTSEYIRFVVAACVIAARDTPYLGKYQINAKGKIDKASNQELPSDLDFALKARLEKEYENVLASYIKGEIDLIAFQGSATSIAMTIQTSELIHNYLGRNQTRGLPNLREASGDLVSSEKAEQRAKALAKFIEEFSDHLIDDVAKSVAIDTVAKLRATLNLDFDLDANVQHDINRPDRDTGFGSGPEL